MSPQANNRWKDALLKSSLPLEHLVAEVLNRNRIYVSGEFSYVRPNENGQDTEFSVDLNAFELLKDQKHKYWGTLNFLLECKYCYPGTAWIFAPHISDISISCVSLHEDLCTQRIANPHPIYRFDNDLPYCTRGVQLNNDGIDSKNIPHGLAQLRYGIPHFLHGLLAHQIGVWNDQDLHIEFLCPILVTTSSLRVMKRGLSLAGFQSASELDEVSDVVPAIVFYQDKSDHLYNYAKQIFQGLLHSFPEIGKRLQQAKDILEPGREKWLSITSDLEMSFMWPTQRVLIVSFDAFHSTLNEIRHRVKRAGQSRRRFAVLQKDMKKREKWLALDPLGTIDKR